MPQTLAQFAEVSPDPAYEWRVRADAVLGSCWREQGYAKLKSVPELTELLNDTLDANAIQETVVGVVTIQHDYLYFNTTEGVAICTTPEQKLVYAHQIISLASYTLEGLSEQLVLVDTDAIGADATIKLPFPATDDDRFDIKNIGTLGLYQVIIDGNGNTIDGESILSGVDALDDKETLTIQYIDALNEWVVV